MPPVRTFFADKAVSCKSKDKPVAPKPTTKKPTTSPKDCVDYDGDDLCGDKDKCPFSTDNDSDGDDLCELHCTPTPKEMLNRIEAEKKDREIDSRDSGNNRYEDNRPKSLFQKEFVGKWYTCLRTDPCPQDPDNKCKKDDEKPTKPAVTSKPGKCLDFDDDGVCNKDDKCVFSADNDNDKDDLCEIHCQKQPDGYESKQKIDVEKEKREIESRDSGKSRYEDNRQHIFKKEIGGDTYICLRTDPCPNDKSNSCKPKKDDEDKKCKDVACNSKKNVRVKCVPCRHGNRSELTRICFFFIGRRCLR